MSSYSRSTEASFASQKPFSKHFKQWLNKRIPPQSKITLNQKNIFIFPTRTGFTFLGLLLLLLIAAINYENSLIFGLTFWLSSIFFITIFYTFRNLANISFELQKTGTGFVDEDIEFAIKVTRPEKSKHEGVQLGWPDQVKQWAEIYTDSTTTVHCFVNATKRGILNPKRLLVETYYPLGLLRAWTWIDLDAKAIVYPKPIFHSQTFETSGDNEDGQLTKRIGSNDFHDMRNYQAGDSPKHILWRNYARQDELYVKEFAAYADARIMLDWFQVEGDTELRLSRLTGMALTAHKHESEFGLKLPQQEIPPNSGKAHLQHVLATLALFGFTDEITD